VEARRHRRSPGLALSVRGRDLALLAVLTAIGFLLRLLASQESLYADELFTYSIVTQPTLAEVLDQIEVTENTPPGFYLLGWLAAKIHEPTLFARLPSMVFGAAAVPAVYLLTRSIGGRRAGLLAAALIAVAPFAVFFGSEARAYAMLTCLLPLSTLALLRAVESDRGVRWWVLYWLAATAALYSHYIAVFTLALQACWALWLARARWQSIVVANAAVGLAFLPWFVTTDGNKSLARAIEVLHPLTVENVLRDTGQALVGHPAAPLGDLPGALGLGMLALAAAIAVFAHLRGPKEAAAGPSRRHLGLTAALVAGPLAATLVYSLIDISLFIPRNLIVVVPYACVLAGLAIGGLAKPKAAAAGALAVGAMLLGSIEALLEYPRPDLRGAAELIEDRSRPGTPVIEPLFAGPGPTRPPSLDIYLDSAYPLTSGFPSAEDWPRTRVVYTVVLDIPLLRRRLDGAARRVGAALVDRTVLDGLADISVSRYERSRRG
jgi:mannosyltransferase